MKFRETFFYRFNEALDAQYIYAIAGKIIDASFVEVPRQRNIREEKELIKLGETPDAWKAKLNKLRQNDRDERLAKKNKIISTDKKTHQGSRKTKLMSDLHGD